MGLNAFNERSAVGLVCWGFSPRGFVPSRGLVGWGVGTFVPIGAGYTEKDSEGIDFQKELRAKVSGWVGDGYKAVLGLVSATGVYFGDGTDGIRVDVPITVLGFGTRVYPCWGSKRY